MKTSSMLFGLLILGWYSALPAAESCPANVAPGMYSIQIMVTDSEKKAVHQARKLGYTGWAYKHVSGRYHVMSGHFEHAELADRTLERLLEREELPADAFIIEIKPERILRGVCT